MKVKRYPEKQLNKKNHHQVSPLTLHEQRIMHYYPQPSINNNTDLDPATNIISTTSSKRNADVIKSDLGNYEIWVDSSNKVSVRTKVG